MQTKRQQIEFLVKHMKDVSSDIWQDNSCGTIGFNWPSTDTEIAIIRIDTVSRRSSKVVATLTIQQGYNMSEANSKVFGDTVLAAIGTLIWINNILEAEDEIDDSDEDYLSEEQRALQDRIDVIGEE